MPARPRATREQTERRCRAAVCGEACLSLGRAAIVELYLGCVPLAMEDAGASAACFSPTQNLDHAYDPGAVGCACTDTDAGLCLDDGTGRLVALVCPLGHWRAVNDGPCWVYPAPG